MKITLHPWLNSALLLEFAMFFVLVMMDPYESKSSTTAS